MNNKFNRFKEIEKIVNQMLERAKKIKEVPIDTWSTRIELWEDNDYFIEMMHRELNMVNGIENYSFVFHSGDKQIWYREQSIKTEGSDKTRAKIITQKQAIKLIDQLTEGLDKKTIKEIIKKLEESDKDE